MAKPPRPWIVTRHDALEQLDENLWAVDGDVPGFPPAAGFHRRMSIVKLSDGRLLFFNAMPVLDATLDAIRALGKPALLLVPHHLHAIDAHSFREKLDLAVYTAAQSIEKVRAILPVAGALEDLPRDPAFSIETLPSSKFGEAGVVVKSGPRASLLVCDILLNVPHGGGFAGFMFKLLGFTGPVPKLAPMVRLRAFSDKAAARKDLLRLADLPGLTRIVPSHGPVIANDPAGTLARAARAV